MSWLAFSLIGMVFTTTYSLISKKMLTDENDHHPISYAAVLFIFVGLYSAIAYLFSGWKPHDLSNLTHSSIWPVLLLNLLCYVIAPSLYYRALKYLPASEITILYSLTGVYALVLGVMIGTEAFIVTRALGAAAIIGGICLVSWKTGRWKNNKYSLWMIFATLVYAVGAMTDTHIIQTNLISPLFFQTLNFSIPSVLVLIANRGSITHVPKVLSKKVLPLVALNALFFFAYFFSIYQAYSVGGEASQVALVLATETVVVVILAFFFLKERDHLVTKLVAAALAGLGVYLLR